MNMLHLNITQHWKSGFSPSQQPKALHIFLDFGVWKGRDFFFWGVKRPTPPQGKADGEGIRDTDGQ